MISNVTATDTTGAATAMKKTVGMNKDDFLKLYIAQMRYQDPLAPQDPSAMLDQLSQMSLVEQSYNTNTALAQLLAAQTNSMTLGAVSFIGKEVKASGNAAYFDGTAGSKLNYNLSSSIESGTITIKDSVGNTVRTVELGASASGDASFAWDGRDNAGNLLPAGAYTFSVAGSSGGISIPVTTYTTGKVDGVSMAGDSLVVMIGSVQIALTDILNVREV